MPGIGAFSNGGLQERRMANAATGRAGGWIGRVIVAGTAHTAALD